MKGKAVLVGGILVIAVAAIALAAVLFMVLRPTAEASGPITSVPINLAGTELGEGATVGVESAAGAIGKATPGSEAAAAGSTGTATSGSEEAAAGSGTTIFVIQPDASEARFTLDELLRGQPTTVVGVTNQVAGEIAVDPENPTASQVGIIQVNARTLATDNNMRNRAIGNSILQTGTYEFITFTPTAVSGLPDKVAVGEPFSFQVAGDLTIRDITKAQMFQVTVTPVSQVRLEGYAFTTINRSDYQLTIPSVPSVAGVDEQVLIELEFVAVSEG